MIPDGFLKAILEHPDDDAPRLILADWLQDNGQEKRAEFIRTQISLANCAWEGTGARCEQCEALRRRERELLSIDNVRAWFAPLFPHPWSLHEGNVIRWHDGYPFENHRRFAATVRRGFVEQVTMSSEDWPRSQWVLEQAPIREVYLTTFPHAEVRRTPVGSSVQLHSACRLEAMPHVLWFSCPKDMPERDASRFLLKYLWPNITFRLDGLHGAEEI